MRVTKYPIAPEVLSDDYILIDSDENGTRRFPANDFMPNDIQVNQATASEAGIVKLYTGTGTNTDGAINQSAMTTLLNNKAGTNTGTTSSAGLTKLYSTTGNNTDGTMTQSAITNAIQSGGVEVIYSANGSYSNDQIFFDQKSDAEIYTKLSRHGLLFVRIRVRSNMGWFTGLHMYPLSGGRADIINSVANLNNTNSFMSGFRFYPVTDGSSWANHITFLNGSFYFDIVYTSPYTHRGRLGLMFSGVFSKNSESAYSTIFTPSSADIIIYAV